MAEHVPLMMQGLLNRPLAMRRSFAETLIAGAAGRLNVHALARGRGELGEVDAAAAVQALGSAPMVGATHDWRPYELTDSGIAVIRVQGTLVRSCDIWDRIFGGVTSYEDLFGQILFAQQEDAQCRGVFMAVNSNGGLVDGLFDLTDAIHSLSARNGGKPIFAHCGDHAYSAGYAIASAADKLFVPETGGVGSIGVLVIHADITAALDEAGVRMSIFRSGARKAIGIDGVEALDDEEERHLQSVVDEIGAVFFRKVAAYMPALTQTAVSEMQGRDYTGPRAKAIGLVSDVASEPQALMKLERRIAR